MSRRIVSVESENLEAVAVMNGKAKADVVVQYIESKIVLHADVLDPVASKQRDAFIEHLPPHFEHEGSILLGDLAEEIVAERAQNQSVRKEAQGKALSLPTIEPWEAAVDGAELLDEIAAMFGRFVVMHDHQRDALALWVMHAHAHDAAQVSPILVITSAEKRSGKTTTGTVVGALTPRTIWGTNLTTSTLFRSIERFGPTLIADEVDTYLGDREELRGIINSGHLRSGAFVIRNVGDDFEPRLFSTWSPKVLIGNRASRLNDTIIDRALVIELRRRTQHERVERLRLDRLDAACDTIRRRAARWANDHIDALREADPDVPAILNDRAADNWRALLAIAEEAGEDWSERARVAAVRLSGAEVTSSDDSPGVLLLHDLRQFFADRSVSRAPTREVLSWLHQREGAPWGDWRRGQPITPRGLTRLLEPFHIAPKVLRIGATTHRGYELDQFADAFSRYLPPYPQQESHVNAATTYPSNPGVAGTESVTLRKEDNSLGDNNVTDVTEQDVGNRGEAWEPEELVSGLKPIEED